MAKPIQVVSGDGEFNKEGVEHFLKEQHVDQSGLGYQVVAITGPQSSGKSTLMNAVFGTVFEEMDAMSGRHQTTHGIWMAKSPKIGEPITLVMDLEGSDGRERGEDDTSFERQSSLFALAVADVLLVNMWAKDIGREAGSGKPLLKTIFQVNLKLFTPAPDRRRTVLLFVFRDRTKTPMAKLVETWEADLDRMWASITKPPSYDAYRFSDFFEVKYAALPNFEEREEDFRADAVLLRRRFTDDSEDPLLRGGSDKLPAHALALSMRKVWEVIRSQKDLNLPAHKVMVANIRCAEILEDQLQAVEQDQAWLALHADSRTCIVPDFGSRASAILESALTGYEEEARYFEEGVRGHKREELAQRLRNMVQPLFLAQLDHRAAAALQRFKDGLRAALAQPGTAFAEAAARGKAEMLKGLEAEVASAEVEGSGWSTAGAMAQAGHAADAWAAQLTKDKVAAVMAEAEKRLSEAVTGPAIALLDSCPPDLWARLQRLRSSSLAKATALLDSGLQGYDVPAAEAANLRERLGGLARGKLKAHAAEAANTALTRMKDRFQEIFNRDDSGMPRRWTSRANIPSVAAEARSAAASLLANLAVLRLDPAQVKGAAAVDAAITSMSAADSPFSRSASSRLAAPAASSSATNDELDGAAMDQVDVLLAGEWPGVAEDAVLLGPQQCRSLWRQFLSDSGFAVQQAMATQEANRAASNRMPPLWAVAAIVFLGFNEFVAVLYNPLWLLIILIVVLFGKTVYEELDVDGEMQRGLLPGLLALSSKLVPTIKPVAARSFQSTRHFVADAGKAAAAAAQNHMEKPHPQEAHSQANGVQAGGLRQRRGDGIHANVQEVEMTEESVKSKDL